MVTLMKTNSEMRDGIILNVANIAPIPSRRSIDTLRLRFKLENQKDSGHTISKPDLVSRTTSEVKELDRTSSIRRAMSVAIKHPHNPPPLCSICKHKAPMFGKAPRKFSYSEIEQATGRFSSENFLAEGGYGPVFKGVLPDGQVIAVKQHKILSALGASELCSEVEILSCAQHRNLVMLLGYCIEEEWLLIYEFACNGSLDKHLFGKDINEALPWKSRMKIAIGAARGLRYLHEDCRVGCIIHRDFRPNNILLTHDFEPMVGDFGLARWQADGQAAEETHVIGSFGYLAPEYTQTRLVTEKADVYAFGVVLLELLHGVKATELLKTSGQLFLPEWGQKLLEKHTCHEIIDPNLQNNYNEKVVECMIYAASVCISCDPQRRPRMSQVLKVLDGDMLIDMGYQYPQPKRNSVNAVNKDSDNSPSTHLLQLEDQINFNLPDESTQRCNHTATGSKIHSNKEVEHGWNLESI